MTTGFRVRGSGFSDQGSRTGRVWWLLPAACCLLLVGCGGPGLDTVSVTGRVTYGGGDWPTSGILDFRAVKAAEGKTLHPGSAQFGPDGRFTAKSARSEGLVPGEYTVTVECWQEPPSMDNPNSGKSYVPQKYRNPKTSGLTLVIKADQSSAEFNADIPKE